MQAVKALLFDVFGACVDWRGSVERELARRGLPVELAVAWRGEYQPQLETVRSGARPWTNLDVLHREATADWDIVADKIVSHGISDLGAPGALTGLLIALIIFTPEGVSALKAGYRNQLQRTSISASGRACPPSASRSPPCSRSA